MGRTCVGVANMGGLLSPHGHALSSAALVVARYNLAPFRGCYFDRIRPLGVDG